MENRTGTVIKISGPLILAKHMESAHIYDVVRIGQKRLIGEIIELREDIASIQVYEDTAGIGSGDLVYLTNESLSVELAPGLIEGIFDGIQRPLEAIYQEHGDTIPLGVDLPRLDRKKVWHFHPSKQVGDFVSSGMELGYVQETEAVRHKIMVPFGISGTISKISEVKTTITEPIAYLKDGDQEIKIPMLQTWPVRKKRPYLDKIAPEMPLITGVRVIDTLFPVASGGVAAIPGPFGSGKTVLQHQLAKWSDAEIIVYIGCGERGNEMTDVLMEFPELVDPKTGSTLMKRTILIANTSNMPVAAREASIYTGITIAEYYRDMGYKVAIMADSTSRWAEALREMSGRLEEMPGEEGYPAYLSSRLAEFYERAGMVSCLGKECIGSITAIGAISPPGGDTSEPVSQATLRIVKVFWGLNSALAYRRHYPAIDWLKSYSLYSDVINDYLDQQVESDWSRQAAQLLALLQEESALQEIVRLVGMDALGPEDQAKMMVAQMIREDFLHQDAFHHIDAHSSLRKQFLLAKLILLFKDETLKAIKENKIYSAIEKLPVKEKIGRYKYIEESAIEAQFTTLVDEMQAQFAALAREE